MTASATAAVAGDWLLSQLTAPTPDIPSLVGRLRADPNAIEYLLAAVSSRRAEDRFGAARSLRVLAAAAPDLLYPHYEFFVAQLGASNQILRWNAIRALALLTPADQNRKLDAVLERYLSPINGPDMIAAATVIEGAAVIALARPDLADRLARAILSVRRANYKTSECRNVAIGHAIAAFDRFYTLLGEKRRVLAFVRRQLDNTRPATRKKAAAFLKKHSERLIDRPHAPRANPLST